MPTAAPAGPEAIYLLERTIDVAARELGLAPEELRRRNFIPPAEMPYQTPVESRYDSGDFAAVMDTGDAEGGLAGVCQEKGILENQATRASASPCTSSAAAAGRETP